MSAWLLLFSICPGSVSQAEQNPLVSWAFCFISSCHKDAIGGFIPTFVQYFSDYRDNLFDGNG